MSYNQNFKENLFFIYDTSVEFLRETGHSEADVKKKSSSLLSRSIAVYVTNIMSDMNPAEGFFAKASEAKKLLSEDVVKKAFASELSVPYFEKKTYRMFFVIMSSLIKMRLCTAACFVARVASKRRRR